jgi:hypothetical protein
MCFSILLGDSKHKTGGYDMKTALLIAALVISLALGGNSLVLSHGGVGGEESLQPVPPSDLYIDVSEFSGKENLESLLQKTQGS